VPDQNTSKETLRSLYDRYSNDIFRYAYSVLGDSGDAYDAVQEVFLRAHRAMNSFRHDAHPKTWLMAIARNYTVDVLRKKQKDRKYLTYQDVLEFSDVSTSLEAVMELKDAISQLKHDYREVLVLRYVDEFSIRETALLLGWSEKKIRNTAHRAMTKLREILGDEPQV
jgi:RNA polymerase sigma-70 factor (ECF subfamily)